MLLTLIEGRAVDSNPAVAGLPKLTTSERVLFLRKTGPQRFGEEVYTFLLLLAMMYFLVSRLRVSRRAAIVCAWLSTAVLSGLIRLPTSNWNVVLVVLLIPLARLILTSLYTKTKNIRLSTGTHITNGTGRPQLGRDRGALGFGLHDALRLGR